MSEKTVVIAGYGGQGILFLGTILANAAMLENKQTTWMPSYGAEMRGGHANCTVKISDNEIASPILDDADYAIFLNNNAQIKFENSLKENCTVIANSNLIDNPIKNSAINYIESPLTDLTLKIENGFLNIVTFGYFIKKTGILKKESAIEAIKNTCRLKNEKFLEKNLECFETGYNLD